MYVCVFRTVCIQTTTANTRENFLIIFVSLHVWQMYSSLLAVSNAWHEHVCTTLCYCVLSLLRHVIDITRDRVLIITLNFQGQPPPPRQLLALTTASQVR